MTQHAGEVSIDKTGNEMIYTYRVRAFAFLVLALYCVSCRTTGETGSEPPKLLLRVVNRHFTVGKRIPSEFLKVFSDGMVECHAIKFSDHDNDQLKTMKLSPDELAKVTSALNDPGVQRLAHDYKLFRWVFDSWMEWDITIEQPSYRRNVTLAFSGASDRTAIPDTLRKLDCLILELRSKAYGDDTTYYAPACSLT